MAALAPASVLIVGNAWQPFTTSEIETVRQWRFRPATNRFYRARREVLAQRLRETLGVERVEERRPTIPPDTPLIAAGA